MQKLFFIILFLLEMNVDAMNFWQTVEQFASNPEELLFKLAEVNDVNAKCFCNCFKKELSDFSTGYRLFKLQVKADRLILDEVKEKLTELNI